MTGYAKDVLKLTVKELPLSYDANVNVRNIDTCKTYYKGYANDMPDNVSNLHVLSMLAHNDVILIFAFESNAFLCF